MLTSLLAATPAHADITPALARLATPVIHVPAPTLEPADLLLSCSDGATLAVRYLSPVDLLGAIRQNTLHATCVALRQRSQWAYLLIGGVVTPNADGRVRVGANTSGWAWDAVQGAVLSCQEIGVGVLWLQHADSLGETLTRLARRDRGPARAMPPREGLWYTPAEQILLALPGIGEGKTDALLAFCGSAADALWALTEPDAPLPPGIGPETRKAARAALGLRDDEFLARNLIEPAAPAKKAA